MAKRLLFEKNVLQTLLNLFFLSKIGDKETQFIDKLEKEDPRLGDAFNKLNSQILDSNLRMRKILKDKGLDVSHIDAFLKKHYNITV